MRVVLGLLVVLIILVIIYSMQAEPMCDRVEKCNKSCNNLRNAIKLQEEALYECGKSPLWEDSAAVTALRAEIDESLHRLNGIDSKFALHGMFKYVDAFPTCAGKVCIDAVPRNVKYNLDDNANRMIDEQAAQIQRLNYELVDRNARINALRAEVLKTVGMY